MYVYQGGDTYGFCPAKSTWDSETQELFKLLLISTETGQLLYNGGICNQPAWYIDLLAWFLPRFDNMRFASKAEMILGGDGKSKSKPAPTPRRR